MCLAAIVAANLAASYWLARLPQSFSAAALIPPWNERAIGLLLGVFAGQVYLLTLWLALAAPRAIIRYPLAGIVILGAGAISDGLRIGQSGDGALVAAFAAVIVMAAHLPVLSLRWLFGWRLGFDAVSYPQERAGRTQFYLAHCFWMMALVAFPLALYRALAGLLDDRDDVPAWMLAAIGGAVMLAGLSCTWVVLAARRRWIPAMILLLVLGLGRIGERVVDRLLTTGVMTNGMWILAPLAGVTLAVVLNLGVLRCCGLKLLIVKPPRNEQPAS